MYSLFQHPFITYAFLLSSVMALLVALLLRLLPQQGSHRVWLFLIPLVVPVLSYVGNFVLLRKVCGPNHSYIGPLHGFPSLHMFCRLNYRLIPWIAPASLAWLAVSLAMYGLIWRRTRLLFKNLQVVSSGDSRAGEILCGLSVQAGVKTPELQVLDCDNPLMFTGGHGKRLIVVTTGALRLLDDDELRAALAHELAHVRRMGHVLNWFFVLFHYLTLFSPASLWAYVSFQNEEEKTCDQMAANQTGLGVELASAIVKFIKHGNRGAWAPPLAALLPVGNPGTERVKTLLDTPSARLKRSLWMAPLLALVLILLAFIC